MSIDDYQDRKLDEGLLNQSTNPETEPKQVGVSPNEVKELSFGYENLTNNSDFVSKLLNQYEGDNSLTGLLAKNEQIQALLGDILSNYGNYIKQDENILKKIIEKKKNHEKKNSPNEQGQIVECFEEYVLNNDSQDGFEQFLLSNGCLRGVILSYINDHAIGKDGKINVNLISKNNIKAKIKAEWHKKLYMNYNELYGLEPNEKLTKAMNFGESIKNTIDGIISEYLSNGIGDKEFLESLEGLISRGKNNETIKKILESNPNAMDKYNYILKNNIKEYSRLLDIGNENRTLKKTDDKVFDTQLRAYLFLYGKIFYPDTFKSDGGTLATYEGELGKILEAILISDGKLDKTEDSEMNNKYIRPEENIQNGIMNRDKSARENAWKMRGGKPQFDKDRNNNLLPDNIENGNLDIQNASGVEIAQEMDLGKSLEGFKMNEIKSNNDMIFRRRIAFGKTCKEFLAKNGEKLREFDLKLPDFFYLNNNSDFGVSFNDAKWREFKELHKLENGKVDELKRMLNNFVKEFNDNLKDVDQHVDNRKESVHNVVKEYAIGAVIDNIKDMFQNIIETSNEGDFLSGFEFDEKKSARIENNNLIVSGKFNGEPLILRYDLNSGELYMNAYISINENGQSMTVGDNNPKQKIGELKPFQGVLDDFYNSPTESMSDDVFPKIKKVSTSKPDPSGQESNNEVPRPRRSPRKGIEARKRMKEEHKRKFQEMCGTKMEDINVSIRSHVESRAVQDSTASNLLKTLNIMPENSDYNKIVNLKENSDLFNTISIISNSEKDDIIYFSNFLGKLMPYTGLKWGRNSLFGQDKTTNEAKSISNKANSNEDSTISYLLRKTENFDSEYNQAEGVLVFDSGQHFGILSLIDEKFSEGEPPNGKIMRDKIENFEKDFSQDLKILEQENKIALAQKTIKRDDEVKEQNLEGLLELGNDYLWNENTGDVS